jgi:hypothetical protein
MSGKYGSPSTTCTLEDAPGGTARNIHTFALTIGGVKITSKTEKSDALVDAWAKYTPVGKKEGAPIPFTGHFDTTASTGSHAIFKDVDDGPQDDGREMVIAFGDGKTCTFDVRLTEYEVKSENDKLTSFSASVQPTGAMTWS